MPFDYHLLLAYLKGYIPPFKGFLPLGNDDSYSAGC